MYICILLNYFCLFICFKAHPLKKYLKIFRTLTAHYRINPQPHPPEPLEASRTFMESILEVKNLYFSFFFFEALTVICMELFLGSFIKSTFPNQM